MNAPTLFFYDLETSGISPRSARIMQFAGQRTTLDLESIGEPVNILVRLTEDVLPEPDAIVLTGITPQMTLADGVTEAEFLKTFVREIATPDTIMLGFNTVRFDDEFMRYSHYRNFYDPYEWQWQDGRGKWDLLDVVRMTRALRPDGIKWPFDAKGNPTNRLELLTKLNGLSHEHAHDALSDVYATIEVARLIRTKQPKLFQYLFEMRDKKKVMELVKKGEPFTYASGRYPSEFEKTTVAVAVVDCPKKQGTFVFDLRNDPNDFKDLSAEQLAEAWRWKKPGEPGLRLPIKTLQYNHCPAVAPLGVLDAVTQERLKIDFPTIQKHFKTLKAMQDFSERVLKANEILEKKQQTSWLSNENDVDAKLYDGFLEDNDRNLLSVVRAAEPKDLDGLIDNFKDPRCKALLPLYKARNFPKALSDEERTTWEAFRAERLLGGGRQSAMAKFMARLQDIAARTGLTGEQQYILEELQLYAQSIMPTVEE